jgi:hypothetical protein
VQDNSIQWGGRQEVGGTHFVKSIVEVDNIFGTGRYEAWEGCQFFGDDAVDLWTIGAVPVVGPVIVYLPVYCNDVVVAYHDFGQCVVCVRSIPTFN